VTDYSSAVWRKSSHSDDNYGQCIELAVVPGVIGVRDSKQCDGGAVLEFSRNELSAFLRAVKAGRLPS
jgi:hypothetical protein